MRLRKLWIGLGIFLFVVAGAILGSRYYMQLAATAEFWEDEIIAFEEADSTAPPESGAILFTGSSSIVLWSGLEEDMAPWYVLNRGFGGAHLVVLDLVDNSARLDVDQAKLLVVGSCRQ